MTDNNTLTAAEAMERLGLNHRQALSAAIKAGKLKKVGYNAYDAESVEAWRLARLRTPMLRVLGWTSSEQGQALCWSDEFDRTCSHCGGLMVYYQSANYCEGSETTCPPF